MQTIGKYILTRQLGTGGMGVVYEGRDPALNRHVAIKILRPDTGPDADPRRFRREAEAAARVNHPNCVQIYDIGEENGQPFLVMELVPGVNAGTLVSRAGKLSWTNATRIAIAACKGLTAIHATGLIHRDVKPSNLLISESGAVKLADFGLARSVGEATLSLTGERAIGTPHFMSPEQCMSEPVDARTDVYALGATYYTLLTARPPFQGERDLQIMFAHCNNPTPDACAASPEIPTACAELIRKAMAKPPAERYQTATEMQEALEAILSTHAPTEAVEDASTTDLPALVLPPTKPDAEPLAGSTRLQGTTDVPTQRKAGVTRRGVLLAAIPATLALGAVGAYFAFRERKENPPSGDAKQPEGPPSEPPKPQTPPGAIPPIAHGTVWDVDDPVQAIAITDDNRWVAVGLSGVERTGSVKLFDRTKKGREPVWSMTKTGECNGVAFSPDGTMLAAACRKTGRVIVWSTTENRELEWPQLETECPVSAVAFSPDGKLFAAVVHRPYVRLERPHTNADIPAIRVWSVNKNSATFLRDLPKGTSEIRQLWFSPDSRTLAAAASSYDTGPGRTSQAVLLCNMEDLQDTADNLIFTPSVEIGPSAAFARHTWTLAVARSQVIDFFRNRQLEKRHQPINPMREAFAIALSPDGKLLAAVIGDGIFFFETETGHLREKSFKDHTGTVLTLAFTADGQHLVSGSHDHTVRFWKVPV